MFENPTRGRKARNFTTNAPKILDLKSSSEQIFSRKLPLGAPDPFPFWGRLMKDPEYDDLGKGYLCDLSSSTLGRGSITP